MRKAEINKELEAIRKSFAYFQEGMTMEEIKQAAGLEIELRTLQRRLAEMMGKGIVTKTGDKRTAKWHLAHKTDAQQTNKVEEPEEFIPLTPQSKKVLSQVSRPIQQRNTISYNIEFLRSYRPNEDSYLNTEEKFKLFQLGNTGKPEYPAGTYARQILNRLLIDLSWNSSRLEGNTYSLLDTERLISGGESADNKSPMETQMILNHKEAIEFIVQPSEAIGFNR